jgi:hypothetical protein
MLLKSMKWFFAKNEGGREVGFHDAGVETFQGNINRYLAREVLQNSLDARYDFRKPVYVKFEVLELKRDEVPDIKGLKSAFDRCADYFKHQKEPKAFFERASAIASAKTITALKVGDYNTTGVTGSDDDREGEWYSLIRCAGSSSKSDDEGGSFGLGKNAPFAASRMRTVMYSTYNEDKERAFQGVSMLVSHRVNGTNVQPTGYLGGKNGESVRAKGEIPEAFQRPKMGTDIIVVGFPKEDTWQKDLMYAVLEHFWPAIDVGDLVVNVGGQEVSQKNLGELLLQFSSEEDFTAHHYYKAFKEASYSYTEDLPILKEVKLYLATGDDTLPKNVAMIRKPGMVVFRKRFQCLVPFCGVFLCRNDVGNKILREMEPPRHDDWDPDRPEKGNNKKTESEYIRFIRDCIRKLNATDDTKVISVPGLSHFLPDDSDTPEESFEAGEEQTMESLDRTRLPQTIEGKKIDPRRTATAPDDTPGEGEEEIEGGTFGGGSGGGGGDGGGEGKGGTGKGGGEQPRPTIPIRYRTFATDAGVYAMTVQSEERSAKPATLSVWTVGDQGKYPAEIESAKLRDGKAIPVKGAGQLGPLTLPNQKATLQVEIKLKEPLRFAMEVAAHETE